MYQKLIKIGQSEKEKNIYNLLCANTQQLVGDYLENCESASGYSDMLIVCTNILNGQQHGEKIKKNIARLGNYLNCVRIKTGKRLIVHTTINEEIDINDANSIETRDNILKAMINRTKVVLLCRFFFLKVYCLFDSFFLKIVLIN